MLWLRAALFTALCPGMAAVVVPLLLNRNYPMLGGGWNIGWILIAAGAAVYVHCLFRSWR